MDLTKIPLSIYLVILLVLLLAGVKVKGRAAFFDNFLDLDITKGLQGFAAVAIMLHHITQIVTRYGGLNKGIIGFMNDCGVLLTGMFFFFSGYGLYTSFKTKDNYLKGFLRKRLPAVIVPFYTINTVFVLMYLFFGYQLRAEEALINVLYVTGLVLVNSQMWFIVEIVVLYLAFFVIFRLIKKQNTAFVVMAAFILLLTTMSLLLGHDNKYMTGGAWFKGEWWYNATWVFFVGMLIARFKENVVSFAKKFYAVLLPVGVVLFAALYKATGYMLTHYGYWTENPGNPGYKDKFLTCLVQTPMIIVFVLLFMIITMKLQFHNPVLKFLGKISIELYLLHNAFIMSLNGLFKSDFMYYLIIYVASIILATGIHYADRWLIKKISGKSGK